MDVKVADHDLNIPLLKRVQTNHDYVCILTVWNKGFQTVWGILEAYQALLNMKLTSLKGSFSATVNLTLQS